MSLELIVIVGPTATGKTRLGVEVAHRLGAEIISADSRQVYRGLDIGAGKDLDEYSSVSPPVPYHLIDIVDPAEVYTLYRYQQDCYAVLRRLAERASVASGRVPVIMVGGSGLYVEAVLRSYSIADVPEDPALRARLASESRSSLVRRLGSESPGLVSTTDLSSRKRVIRALEIAAAERRGTVRRSTPLGLELRPLVFGVSVARERLYRRIEHRVHVRLEKGMVEEVEELLRKGVPAERLQMLGLEYRIISSYVLGRIGFREMVDGLEQEIRRFAKRQLTYLRGMERRGTEIRWIAPDASGVVLDCWHERTRASRGS
jgi:tRNA dimethylallyltransferase